MNMLAPPPPDDGADGGGDDGYDDGGADGGGEAAEALDSENETGSVPPSNSTVLVAFS